MDTFLKIIICIQIGLVFIGGSFMVGLIEGDKKSFVHQQMVNSCANQIHSAAKRQDNDEVIRILTTTCKKHLFL